MARPRTVLPSDQTVSVRFPRELWETCHTLAKQQRRSLGAQVVQIVEDWLAHNQMSARKDEKRRAAVSA